MKTFINSLGDCSVSYSTQIYVGPLLVAKYTEVITPLKFSGCITVGCALYHKPVNSGVFCSQCGQKITSITKNSLTKKTIHPTYQDRIDAFDKAGILEEELFLIPDVSNYQGNHVFIISGLGGDSRNYHLKSLENYVLDIQHVDIPGDKLWFTKTFSKEIEVINSIYEKTEVQWAVVTYIS